MTALDFKAFFAERLTHVVDDSFSAAPAQDFEDVAKTLWYSEENLVDVLNFTMEHRLNDDEQKRRLLYMVERFRRFGCVTHEKKKALRDFVQQWDHLKPHHFDDDSKRLVESHRLEELAFSWGLKEDLSSRLQDVLHFQTRHYADSQRSRNGYSEPDF